MATADTTLDCSTVNSLGDRPVLGVGDTKQLAIAFDVEALAGKMLKRATLELTHLHHDGTSVVGVYALDVPIAVVAIASPVGMAAGHLDDKAFGDDPDVVFATDFDSLFWRSEWSYVSPGSRAEVVEHDDGRKFKPFSAPRCA
jgi:hypothetical protein